MKVLVTGGNGFIGEYVQEELIRRNHTPVVFDRHDKRGRFERSELFLGDITNDVDVTEAVAHVDTFIHLAGVLGTAETIKNPNPAAATNILGGLNLFKAAAQYKVPGVNIAVGNHWMNNTYSITKSTMERFADMFNTESGTNITIVRALNAYGPRQVSAEPYGPSKVKKIMPAFINNALRNKPIPVYGDGQQVMDMIYVADVAKVLVSAMERTYDHGHATHVYEAGSGNDTTVNDIANQVLIETGSTAGIEWTPMRPGEPEHSVVLGNPDTLAELNLVADRDFVSLTDGVSQSVKWFREQM